VANVKKISKAQKGKEQSKAYEFLLEVFTKQILGKHHELKPLKKKTA
jgi:hypothetical protein